MSEFISVPMTATEKPRAIKYRGIVYFFRSVKGKTHGMILDRPHLEMLQTRLSALANLRSLGKIYRSSGLMGEADVDTTEATYIVEERMASEMLRYYPIQNGAVAKRMKTARSMLENNYHLHAVPQGMGTGEADRFDMLKEALDELTGEGTNWYDTFISLGLNDRRTLDVAYCFHIVPTEDRDPAVLFSNTYVMMHGPRSFSQAAVDEFLDFVKAIDFSMEVNVSGVRPSATFDEGFGHIVDAVEDKARRVRGYVPEKAYWGKYRIDRHYPYLKKADFAHMEAKDVTRVASDKKVFFDSDLNSFNSKVESNELLHAMVYGDKMTHGKIAEQYRDEWVERRISCDNVADMAAKAENSKAAKSARETCSNDDTHHKLISEADNCASAMIKNFQSVAMGQSPAELDKTIAKLLDITSKAERGIIMSLDITGWSLEAVRELFLRHHDIILSYFQAKEGTQFSTLWEHLIIAIRKKGLNACTDFMDGMIQGWCSKFDCLLHMHLLLWITFDLRFVGLITRDMGYTGLVLIDDAVLAYVFAKMQSRAEKCALAAALCEHVKKKYTSLGLKIAADKTIISTYQFHFLSCHYAEGSEIPLPLRTMMKVDIDPFRLIVSFASYVEELGSTTRGAIAKGTDPIVMYINYLRRCIGCAFRYDFRVASTESIELAIIMFAPGYLGGWSMAAYCDMLMKEKTDALRPVNVLLQKAARYASGKGKAVWAALERVINGLYFREMREPNVWAFMAAPRAVSVKGIADPTGPLRHAVTLKLRSIKVCSDVRAAFGLDRNKVVADSMWTILRSCVWDVSVIETLAPIRPLASSMSQLKKLLDRDTVRTLLAFGTLSRLRRRSRRESKSALRAISRAIAGLPVCNDTRTLARSLV